MRRPIAARNSAWAKRFAQNLARAGISPNAVSVASVVFAAVAGILLALTPRLNPTAQCFAFLGAAACIQARLLCNLFDGMLAVEWNRASKLGAIFNDFPDRPADVFILLGCGYVTLQTPILGFIAAIMALLTAYTRVLGAAIGAGEHFVGPMAKQHRMAVATIACVLSAGESALRLSHRTMEVALIFIILGCVITTARRLKLIARDLEGRA